MDRKMKKMKKITVSTLALFLLASCGTVGDYKRSDRGKKLGNSCDSAYAQTLIGKEFKALKKYQHPVRYRLIKPGLFVTQDYNPARVNLHMDNSGKIQKISCG